MSWRAWSKAAGVSLKKHGKFLRLGYLYVKCSGAVHLKKRGCSGIVKLVVSKICHFYLNILWGMQKKTGLSFRVVSRLVSSKTNIQLRRMDTMSLDLFCWWFCYGLYHPKPPFFHHYLRGNDICSTGLWMMMKLTHPLGSIYIYIYGIFAYTFTIKDQPNPIGMDGWLIFCSCHLGRVLRVSFQLLEREPSQSIIIAYTQLWNLTNGYQKWYRWKM